MTDNGSILCPRCEGDAANTAGCIVCDGTGRVPAGFTVLVPEPLAKIEAPLAEWVGTLGGDPWLTEELRGQVNTHDPYHTAVVAGLTTRLYKSPKSEQGVVLFEQMDRVWLWARELTDAQVKTLEHLVATECGMLLADMCEHGYPDLQGLCERRDDLAAVVGVLVRSGRYQDWTGHLLDVVDEAGKLAVKGKEIPKTARLDRAAIGNDGWWLPTW